MNTLDEAEKKATTRTTHLTFTVIRRTLFGNATAGGLWSACNSPDDWWPMILGSGYRGTVDQLSASEREQVRAENLAFIKREAIRSVEANVVYAIGKKH